MLDPAVLNLKAGCTVAPQLLAEAELIARMEKEAIGTDATIADHIGKIQKRKYVDKDQSMRFSPATLGLGLVDGYQSLPGRNALVKVRGRNAVVR